jgi:hypothetical protein
VVSARVCGAELSGAERSGAIPVLEKTRRDNRRASASQHLHPGLRTEHPLLIGGKDKGLLAGQVVRLGADVPFSIEEQHSQQLTCGIKELH